MHSQSGLWPEVTHVPSGRQPGLCEGRVFRPTAECSRGVLGLGLLLALLWPSPGAAQAPGDAPLRLPEAERIALEQEPGMLAHAARAAALRAEAQASGSLPAPALRLGLNNYPIQDGDFSTEGMTNAGVTWRQAFPPGEVRVLRRERLDWEASAAGLEAEARQREVRLGVRLAWLDGLLAHGSRELLVETQPLFRDLVDVTRSLYGVGRKARQDVLRAELELSHLEDRILEARKREAEARATLSRWTGTAAERPLPAALPDLPPLPSAAVLQEALERHPRILAASARLEAGTAAVDLAQEQRRPGWALDLGYAYRDGLLPTGESRSDFFTVGVTLELPVLRRQALDEALLAALEKRDAVTWEREALRREYSARLALEYARWSELGRRVDLFEADILQQATASADATRLAYQADMADFADVMRAAIVELDTRLRHLELRVDRVRAHAALAALGGLDDGN